MNTISVDEKTPPSIAWCFCTESSAHEKMIASIMICNTTQCSPAAVLHRYVLFIIERAIIDEATYSLPLLIISYTVKLHAPHIGPPPATVHIHGTLQNSTTILHASATRSVPCIKMQT